MKILQRLALDATRNTPLQAACQGHFLAEHLSTLVAADFIPCPALDPRRDPPLPWLEEMCRIGTDTQREPRHGIVDVLGRLLVEGEPYEAEIPLRAIVGVTASKAENRMELDSLPETMHLADGETFGPLPDTEMHRLREAVIQEFPLRHGVFRVDLQRWNGAYVAGNQGSSRRFALWRRLSQLDPYPVTVPAVVTPHDLDAHALHAHRSRWRLIYAHADGALGAVMDAEAILPDSFYSFGRVSPTRSDPQFWVVPYVHHVPPRVAERVDVLHRRLDEAGVLDVGRALTEQISVAKRRASV